MRVELRDGKYFDADTEEELTEAEVLEAAECYINCNPWRGRLILDWELSTG